MEIKQLLLGYPEFVWQGIFSLGSTLIAGLIIAFVTTFYLKKKDEITRVAGVILEKRINSEQALLDFLEDASFSLEMRREDRDLLYQLLVKSGLETPHGQHLQYAKIFESHDAFQRFFRAFEQHISRHKLWLSKEVRFHLELMLGYFSWVNASLLTMNRIPLPDGIYLSDDEAKTLSDKIILIQGISLDNEIKGLIAHLEVLMVDSICRLNLKRSKNSLMRNGFLNRETKKIVRSLSRKTLLGLQREHTIALIMALVYQLKGLDLEQLDIEALLDEFPEPRVEIS